MACQDILARAWGAGVALLAANIFIACTPLQVVTHRVSTNEASAPAGHYHSTTFTGT
jgi:hypothetical protein